MLYQEGFLLGYMYTSFKILAPLAKKKFFLAPC